MEPLFMSATTYSPTHLSRAVQSAQQGLTSVFGMGTGVSPAVRSPASLTWATVSAARFQAWVSRRTWYVDLVKNLLRGSWEPQILRRAASPSGAKAPADRALLRMTNQTALGTLA